MSEIDRVNIYGVRQIEDGSLNYSFYYEGSLWHVCDGLLIDRTPLRGRVRGVRDFLRANTLEEAAYRTFVNIEAFSINVGMVFDHLIIDSDFEADKKSGISMFRKRGKMHRIQRFNLNEQQKDEFREALFNVRRGGIDMLRTGGYLTR